VIGSEMEANIDRKEENDEAKGEADFVTQI
jgi:hypothetical protein